MGLLLVLLALGAFAGCIQAEQIEVPWSTRHYDPMTAVVGDTVVFTWSDHTYNVFLHPSGTCVTTDHVGVGNTPSISGANYTFTEAGTFTFACEVGRHCAIGQIVTFTVTGGGGGGGGGSGGGTSCADIEPCAVASDACHIAGTCSGGAGSGLSRPAACSAETEAADGTECGDGKVCTAGVCENLPAKASDATITVASFVAFVLSHAALCFV